ncbi:gentisate 1,2-dioxygenase [Colletotrichum salicis]|uniref:Gentisate 1,2-dioxygenase n=1 Tax=Colletotrichum salicis TaxID=1209931 RepID=A0A135TIS5_9PEZI|nr:gentisate 1,2-dioxygenase [Colletotrichum salicis]
MDSPHEDDNKAKAMNDYLEELPSQHMEPLWSKMNVMVPPTPAPVAKPHMWKYADSLPLLHKAAEMVGEKQAERRVLMLVNPNMESPYTTDTIYGGLQIVNPGETAPAHRHIAFALRFIIDGEGFTAVEGKKMPLRRGDVVVTPTWHWHDHGNESDAPVIWLDALNLPLFRFTPVHFAEQYHESRYPSVFTETCEWRHSWDQVEAELKAQEGPYAIHHYTSHGKPLSPILGAQAERIDGNHTTKEVREQASFMYHCYEGQGRTIVEPPTGPRVVFKWTSRDTFAVPAWSRIQHINEGSTTAYLVAVSDRPLLSSIGLTKPQS